ncbi:hypothetical protein [Mucilaginibacter sp.]
MPELEETNQLLRWASSLKHSYSDWLPGLSPPADKSDLIIIVNAFFCGAVQFIMYHEVAHLAGNHKEYLELRKLVAKSEHVTVDEATILKQLETEADNYAFECMVSNTNEEVSVSIGMAILIGQSAQLYLIREAFQLTPQTYPDIDTRLFNIKQKIKSENQEEQSVFDLIHNVGLTLFLNHLHLKYHPVAEDASSGENLLDAQYKAFDLFKADLARGLKI